MEEYDFNSDANNIEQGITEILDATLKAAQLLRPDIPEDTFKSMIVANNLRTLVNLILIADDPESGHVLNLKQVALGLLATSDWIEPDMEQWLNAK